MDAVKLLEQLKSERAGLDSLIEGLQKRLPGGFRIAPLGRLRVPSPSAATGEPGRLRCVPR